MVQSVEETDRVEEVFCAEVEEGHAFVLEDNILTGNCFGCGEGGDVIWFLMKHDGLGFNQAVEYLADKYRRPAALHRGRPGRPRATAAPARAADRGPPARRRSSTPSTWPTPTRWPARAVPGRARLRQGGRRARSGSASPRATATRSTSTCARSSSPTTSWSTAGLVAEGQRGHYDRFRGRLLWPIRETSGETIGFGARRIFDDDRIEAKYLNTPETPIYKKSHVLYGIDLARREIARASQAVVVEGYTDVMACHLAGVPTAVATCGTAFGEDHGRVLRRLLHDHEEFRGEVIFTFDGDEAGQKAALRAFGGDQQFVGQTYVAVEPDGLDPCDLRLQKGDAAVRELVARRIPLYRFVLGNVVSRYDLDRADGRIDALREAAKLVSSHPRPVQGRRLRPRAGRHGRGRDRGGPAPRCAARRAARPGQCAADPVSRPDAAGPQRAAARRCPTCATPASRWSGRRSSSPCSSPRSSPRSAADLGDNDFTHPTYRAIWEAVAALGGPAAAPDPDVWVDKLRDALGGRRRRSIPLQAFNALAVEPLLAAKEPDRAYAAAHVYRLQELTAMRRIADLKSRAAAHQPGRAGDGVQPDVR